MDDRVGSVGSAMGAGTGAGAGLAAIRYTLSMVPSGFLTYSVPLGQRLLSEMYSQNVPGVVRVQP